MPPYRPPCLARQYDRVRRLRDGLGGPPARGLLTMPACLDDGADWWRGVLSRTLDALRRGDMPPDVLVAAMAREAGVDPAVLADALEAETGWSPGDWGRRFGMKKPGPAGPDHPGYPL